MTFHGAGFDLTGGSQALHTLQSLQNIQGNMLLKSYYLGGGGGGAMVMPGITGYPTSTQSSHVGGGGGVTLNSVPGGGVTMNSVPGGGVALNSVGGGGVAVNSVPQMMSHLQYPGHAPPPGHALPPGPPVISAKEKKFRPPARSALKSQRYIPKPIPVELGNLKTYSNPDVLICGNCRELFSDLMDMLDHKKNYCKMRFTCKCEVSGESDPNHSCQGSRSPSAQSGCEDRLEDKNPSKRVCLRCTQCKETFTGAWDLMFHVQNAHSVNIYSLGERKKSPSSESEDKDSDISTANNKISTTSSDSQLPKQIPNSQPSNKIPNSFPNPQPAKSEAPQIPMNSSVTTLPHQSPAFNRHHATFQQKQKFNKHFNNSQKTATISAPPVLLNM